MDRVSQGQQLNEWGSIVRPTVWPLEVTEVGKSVKNATQTFKDNHFSTVIPRILLLHISSLFIGRYPKLINQINLGGHLGFMHVNTFLRFPS